MSQTDTTNWVFTVKNCKEHLLASCGIIVHYLIENSTLLGKCFYYENIKYMSWGYSLRGLNHALNATEILDFGD